MSLMHRRGSIEGFNPEQGTSTSPAQRKLSFNPTWTDALEDPTIPAIGAFEVPRAKRISQVFLATIYCLLGAGIVFGYAALKPVLVKEDVYKHLCTKKELKRGGGTCPAQELRLNLMFTVAAVGTNVAALPIGAILDTYGPRVCGVIGSLLLEVGALLFAFAWQVKFIDAYLLGYLFLALGGPFIFVSSFQLSNAFPKHTGLILALITGAFDTSSALFLIYRKIYEWSNDKFWPKYFFLLYQVVPVYILLCQTFVMPRHSYKTVGELEKVMDDAESGPNDQVDEHTALLRQESEELRLQRRAHRQSVVSMINEELGSKRGVKQKQQESRAAEISGVFGAMHGKSVRQQILSPWFALITLFTIIQMTRINYFVATIRPQYTYILGSVDKAIEINDYFDFALPLGGAIAIPFIGLLLDHSSTAFTLSFLVSVATIIGVLGVLPYQWAGYANVSLFVVYRPFYYTAVSDFTAKVFGFGTFGTVYGSIICLAGLGNFSQTGLDAILHKILDGNPIPINIGLLVTALVVGICLVTFVAVKAYGIERQKLVEEAENASEVAMPGSSL